MVYVDDAMVAKHGRNWCHLVADSLEELHKFAAEIGINPRAFHRQARHPHYDISTSQRERAIHHGAQSISPRNAIRVVKAMEVSIQAPIQQQLFC